MIFLIYILQNGFVLIIWKINNNTLYLHMKYILTATNNNGERAAEVLVTKTTRRSKLVKKIDILWERKYGHPFSTLKDVYVGILNKHTKTKL